MKHDFDQVINRVGTDAKKYSKYASDVIPMWIADSDFLCPQPVIDAILERAKHGIFGYMDESVRLKKAVCKWMEERFSYPVALEEVGYIPVVLAGVVALIRALSQPGDQIVMQSPSYPPFTAAAKYNDRPLVLNHMKLTGGRYELDFDDFEEKCRDERTKLFILCNPQNPTGRVFTKEELTRLGDICLKHNVFVISDEIHLDLVYQPNRHIPFGSLGAQYAQNSVSLLSTSKTFNLPGLRTASFISKNPAVTEKMRAVLTANKQTGENVFGTLASSVAYEQCAYYADGLLDYLQGNQALVRSALGEIRGIELVEPEATYLLWLDCRKTGLDQKALMETFIEKAKVGVQDGLEFGQDGEGFVRMNIAYPKATLNEALSRLKAAFV